MPRNPLGRAKRSVVVSVRLTEDEANELAELYGSKEKGLYALYVQWKEKQGGKRTSRG